MSLVTINDVAVLSGTILMPLVGVWTADLVIDAPGGAGFDGGTAVTIQSENGYSLLGTVVPNRAGSFLDAIHVRVAGGKAGMGTLATARSFAQPGAYVRDVINSLMNSSGETLSSTTDQSLLSQNLVAWSIMRAPVSDGLRTLLDIVAPLDSWRILADGALWIGAETWPSASVTYDLMEQNPSDGSFELGVEAPSIAPGTSIDGIGQVNRVEHQILKGSIRSKVWTNLQKEERGLQGAIATMVRQATAGIDFFTLYDAKVVSQSSDLTTVDVNPLDPRLAGLGRVPLRHGLPGVKVQFSAGAIVRLGWDRGDPSKPYACLFNGGETVQSIQLAGNTPVARKDDQVKVTIPAGSFLVSCSGSPAVGVLNPAPIDVNGTIQAGSGIVGCG